MGIPHYLAMTAGEWNVYQPPAQAAWMACHFSPYHGGLSNVPTSLPAGSLLILDDSTPMEGHDPQTIQDQLIQCITALDCGALLLDFQRPENDCQQALARQLAEGLSLPVVVSHLYAKELDCPVFLPPGPLYSSLDRHLSPWQGRDIWLETALDSVTLTLTEEGCATDPALTIPEEGFLDEKLHCHYRASLLENAARFTLWRTREDLESLLAEAEALGVTTAVGLWQELLHP